MTATVDGFRAAFVEFSSQASYPSPQVSFWLTAASAQLDPGRWGALLDQGTYLFTAHNLSIQAKQIKTAAMGGVPGQAAGPLNSKSVDKVSMAFDTASAAEEGGGHWNMTIYGQQYLRLAKMVGAGPIMPGMPATGDLSDFAPAGWPGVVQNGWG